jgi:hypothetical protein
LRQQRSCARWVFPQPVKAEEIMETKYIVKFHSSATESSAKVLNTKVVNLFDDPGCRSIELLDKSTKLPPKNVRVKRAGNDLQVRIDDAAEGPIDLVTTPCPRQHRQ